MPNVGWGVFGGENRKKSPFLLSQGESVLARNMDLSSGKAKPFRAPSFHKQAVAGTQDIAFFAGALRELPFVAETAAVGLPRGGRREQLLITGAGQAPQQMQTDGTRARLGAPYRNAPPALTAAKSDPTPQTNTRDYAFACSVLMADGTESPLWGVLQDTGASPNALSLGEGGSFPGLRFDVPVDNRGMVTADDAGLETEFARGSAAGNTPARLGYETPYGVRLYQQVSAAAYTKVEDVLWANGQNIVTENNYLLKGQHNRTAAYMQNDEVLGDDGNYYRARGAIAAAPGFSLIGQWDILPMNNPPYDRHGLYQDAAITGVAPRGLITSDVPVAGRQITAADNGKNARVVIAGNSNPLRNGEHDGVIEGFVVAGDNYSFINNNPVASFSVGSPAALANFFGNAQLATGGGTMRIEEGSENAKPQDDPTNWEVIATPTGNEVRRFTFGQVRYGVAPAVATQAEFVGIETRPRLDLRGIVAHPKGFMCGFSGNFLCFSAAEQYGVWPRSYEVEIPEGDIIAIAEFASDLYVFVDNNPPLRVRLDSPLAPDIRRSESTFILQEANARAVVNMGQLGLWYPAKQGIVALPNGRLITDAILDENDFAAPTFAFNDADEYFGARAADNLYLTRRGVEPGFIQAGRIDHQGFGSPQASAKDGATIYLLHASGEISIWASGEPMVMTWKSGRVKLYDENNPPVLVWIYAGQADAHVRFYGHWQAPIFHVEDGEPVLPDFASDGASAGGAARFFGDGVLVEENREGDINIKVHAGLEDYNYEGVGVITPGSPQVRGGAIEIQLPKHGNPDDTMDEDVCDCVVNVPMVGEVSFLQLEFSSERMVEFVGFFGSFDDFVMAKQRYPVFPAPGFVG